jgi:hypothetical protein
MPDPLTRAAYCPKQAEQCLLLAEAADTPELAEDYRAMSQVYRELGEAERRMATRLGLQ